MVNRAVIVGASSGVGRALAEALARRRFHLLLASRDPRDLVALAAHLELRWETRAYVQPLDLLEPDLDVRPFCATCRDQLGGLDAVFLPVGMIDPADVGPATPQLISKLVRSNYWRVIELVSEFGRILERRGSGTIVTFSSISAAAPRRQNTVYSSTKAALETYCRGLRHYFRDSEIIVQTYALGYVDTAMTFGQKLIFPVASPASIADHVVRNLEKDRGIVHLPRFWAFVIFLLKHLPWFLYKRLSF